MTRAYNPASLYLAPTLVIGLGGTGVEIVRLVKGRVRQAHGTLPEIVEFLALDTEPCPNLPGQERIFEREFGYLGDYSAGAVLENINAHPHIKDWWFEAKDVVSGTIHKGARQRRPVGRLSLYVRWGQFSQRLERKGRRIREIIRKEKEQREGKEVERDTGAVQIYLISSLCGGTGSGTLLDVAFRLRKEFGDNADIVGVLLLPSCFIGELQSLKQQRRIKANAYATLMEINHFMQGKEFKACFPEYPYLAQGRKVTFNLTRPFDSIYMVDSNNGKEFLSNLDAIRRMAAQQIYLDLLTPLGKRRAARRANLNDLSGENVNVGASSSPNTSGRHKRNGASDARGKSQATKQSLSIGGFVTASLMLPGENILDGAISDYSTAFIRYRIIGKTLTTADEQNLQSALDTRFNILDRALQSDRVSRPAVAAGRPMSLRDKLLDGATAQQSAGAAGATPEPAPTADPNRVRNVYTELMQKLEGDFTTGGYHRLAYVCEEMIKRVEQRLIDLGQDTEKHKQALTKAEATLTAQTRSKNPVRAVVDGVLNVVSSVLSSRSTPLEDEVTRRGVAMANANRIIAAAKGSLASNEQMRASLEQAKMIFTGMAAEAHGRIANFSYLVAELQPVPTATSDAEGNIYDAGRAETSEDHFELATIVGRERYPVSNNGRVHKASFLEMLPHNMTNENRLSPSEEDALMQSLMDSLLHMTIEVTPTGLFDLKVQPMPGQGVYEVGAQLRLAFLEHIQRLGLDKSSLRIVDYLKWFYTNVRYDAGMARNTPIDPLRMLRHRCSAPFLMVDEARLGSENQFNTEDVRLLGVGELEGEDAIARDVLDEMDTYEQITTGVPERLDVSFSRHGYPMRALSDLGMFRNDYLHFTSELGELLHIHRDWPYNADFRDLVTGQSYGSGRGSRGSGATHTSAASHQQNGTSQPGHYDDTDFWSDDAQADPWAPGKATDGRTNEATKKRPRRVNKVRPFHRTRSGPTSQSAHGAPHHGEPQAQDGAAAAGVATADVDANAATADPIKSAIIAAFPDLIDVKDEELPSSDEGVPSGIRLYTVTFHDITITLKKDSGGLVDFRYGDPNSLNRERRTYSSAVGHAEYVVEQIQGMRERYAPRGQ